MRLLIFPLIVSIILVGYSGGNFVSNSYTEQVKVEETWSSSGSGGNSKVWSEDDPLTLKDFQGTEQDSEFYNKGYTNWHFLNQSQPTEIQNVPKNVWNPEGVMKVYDLPTSEELPYHWMMMGYYSPVDDKEFWGYDLGDNVIIYDWLTFRSFLEYYDGGCQRSNDIWLWNPFTGKCEEVEPEIEYVQDKNCLAVYQYVYDYQERLIDEGCVSKDKVLSISWHSPTVCDEYGSCGRGYSSAQLQGNIVTFNGKQMTLDEFKESEDVAWFIIGG